MGEDALKRSVPVSGRFSLFLSLVCLSALAGLASAQSPDVVRTIRSANPEPQVYDWCPHNRLGIERATFVGVKAFNRVQLREESGDVVEVPFFHFTARDLGELMNKMARFPAETKVIDHVPGKQPLVEIRPSELKPGPLERMPNHGTLGGGFHSMNQPPVVEDIQGRRAVHFDGNQWFYDTQWTAMVLDAIPARALREGMPFTLSTWVLHPKDPDGDDPEMIMSWHGRGGNNGTGLDWKRGTGRGDFYVMGLGGDLWVDPDKRARPMPEWTHVSYVYTGEGLRGELRMYENGRLVATAKSRFVPELREPARIAGDSVVLKGYLDTVDPGQRAYVRGYIGAYDAHHFGQLRHIGRWDQMNEIGLKPRGEFEIPFKDLKPGTLYYYRIFATEDPTSYENPGEPTRRWANGAGRFITATEDGKPGQVLPLDTDRYIFLGCQWGSRWYSSFSGPAGLFRGYVGDLKLFDRALTEDEIRQEANATAAWDGVPADGGSVALEKTDFSWKSGVSTATVFNFYLDSDEKAVQEGTTPARKVAAAEVKDVALKPGLTHYWRVDALDSAGKVLAKGNVWKFDVTYGEPAQPGPGDHSRWSRTGYFRWTQTIGTLKEQRLYLGADSNEVARSAAPLQKFDGNRRDVSIAADKLNFGATYYWRVESVLADDQVVPGPVWKFTVHDYFVPERDGRVSEPYPASIAPGRASKLMGPAEHPTLSTPRADEKGVWDVAHATQRYLCKSRQLREMLASTPCATTLSSHEGPPCVDGFTCGSYGGLPLWNLTMHEMGHQVHGALMRLDPDFLKNQNTVFNLHADNNAWLGDYASANLWENMAVNGQGFISAASREMALREDAPMYHLLARYLPGDLCIDLHPASGLTVAADNRVVKWDNRGGCEGIVPGQQNYDRIPETIGAFHSTGAPRISSVAGAPAVAFDGAAAFLWDRGLKYGFEKNRAWSVEFWAFREGAGGGDEVLLAWGPEDKGVRLCWGGTSRAWSLCGQTADWPAKPGPGRWHHMAFIFEGGGLDDSEGPMRLLVDGREALTKSCKLDLTPDMPVHVGGMVADGKVTGGFAGSLGQIRVYNYALSVDQAVDHYRNERTGYERTVVPHVGGQFYVDLDATRLQETGSAEHFPLYPASLEKPWVRSWANKGILTGRVHNDTSSQWHYSGSTPLYREVAGVQALRFLGKDRMVGAMDVRGPLLAQPAGTLEAVVYSEAVSPDEVVMEWGPFLLDARHLKPGWQHVAVVAQGGNSLVYINGEKAGESPGILKPGANDHLNVGAHFDTRRESWYRFFNGAIAEIRVHEAALPAEQIADNARCAPGLAASAPAPADGARVAVTGQMALSWKSADGAARPVYLGEDSATLTAAGSFKPGEFKPALAGGKRYFWRVGSSAVWSFETARGELVSLSADALPQGPLAAWKNTGLAGGSFVPADRGNLLGMDVESFNGRNGLRFVKGKTLTFRPEGGRAEALAKGPFTIALNVASDNKTDAVPVLTWGRKDSESRLWFGTVSDDRRLLTVGPVKRVGERYPAEQLRMIYPEGCNARMAYVWKTITITYADGQAELWYNALRIRSWRTDLTTGEAGEIMLGWNSDHSDGNILVNDLRIYDRVLKPADIQQLAKTGTLSGTPVVRVSAGDLKPGTRAAAVANLGSLKGRFAAEPEVDRAPKVARVNDRNAVAFDGVAMMTSDFILPEALADARPFTVEIWALQDEPSNGTRLLALSQEVSERYTSFAMGSPANRSALVRPASGADWKIDAAEKPGQWVHLAYVFEGGMHSKIRLYRDGKLNAECVDKTVNTIGGYPLTIGGIMSAATGEKALFKGAISSVSIFDYPRSAEEIAQDAGTDIRAPTPDPR